MSNLNSITTYSNFKKYGKIKIHSILTSTLLCFEMNSNDLRYFINYDPNEQLFANSQNKSGIYFLFNPEEQRIYVGQTNNINDRLTTHKHRSEKDNVFKKVLFIVSALPFNLTNEIIDYLEWHYIDKVKKQDYWISENKELRNKKPNLSLLLQTEIQNYINQIDLYLDNADIDLNIVSNTKQQSNATVTNNDEMIFKLKECYLTVDSNGLRILKGSKIVNLDAKQKDTDNYRKSKLRTQSIIAKQLENGVIKLENHDKYMVLNDFYVPNITLFTTLACGYYGKVQEDIFSVGEPKISLRQYLNNLDK